MVEEMGSVAIAEPIENVGVDESVETPVEGAESGGAVTETGNEGDSSVEKDGLTGPSAGKGKLNLADVVKKSSDALKAINPALPAAMRTAAFELGSLYREFPGGLKEAVAQKQILSEYGGAEGLKETQEAISDYTALEGMFEKGDGAFMERLAESLPASFSKIMPSGLAKWKAVDPESYNHHQAKVFVQTLDQFKVSDTLAQIWQQVEKPEIKQALEYIWNQIDGLRKVGEKAPERKTNPQDEALTRREQELAQREQRALLSPIANEGRQQIQSITDREMTASYKWAETDPSVKEAVSERVRQEVVKASQKDSIFMREFDRLKDRGDAQGLSRHVKNFQDRVTPSVVQRVAKLFAVKPKGAGIAVVKKPVATNGNGVKQEANWTRISQQPSAREIDYGKTNEDMIFAKKAVLKDGRRVNW
jgi:hypothetical protein